MEAKERAGSYRRDWCEAQGVPHERTSGIFAVSLYFVFPTLLPQQLLPIPPLIATSTQSWTDSGHTCSLDSLGAFPSEHNVLQGPRANPSWQPISAPGVQPSAVRHRTMEKRGRWNIPRGQVQQKLRFIHPQAEICSAQASKWKPSSHSRSHMHHYREAGAVFPILWPAFFISRVVQPSACPPWHLLISLIMRPGSGGWKCGVVEGEQWGGQDSRFSF